MPNAPNTKCKYNHSSLTTTHTLTCHRIPTSHTHPVPPPSQAFATIYFIAYVVAVLMLLANLLIAMVIHTHALVHSKGEKVWRLRWASYILK